MMAYDPTECLAAGCHKKWTHTLKTLVHADGVSPEFEQENQYCLEHAIYFAGWLPWCYLGKYTVISITPLASELFNRS